MEELPTKTPHFGTSMRISSLNVYPHIAAQNEPIITLDGSKCVSLQDTHFAIIELRGWGHFMVKFTLFSKSSLQWGFHTVYNECGIRWVASAAATALWSRDHAIRGRGPGMRPH
jgi:hypothetical protein